MIVRMRTVMFIEAMPTPVLPGGYATDQTYYPAEKYASIELDTDTGILCIKGKDGAQRWAPWQRVRWCEPMPKEPHEAKR